jgi:uncharacterized membrane protein
MADIEHKVTIACPISDVYKIATDYGNVEGLQAWQSDLKTVGVTAGDPLRTGSMIGMTRRFMTSAIFVNADVVDLQRNKRFELRGIHGRFPFHREIEFSPNGRETVINDKISLRVSWFFFWYRPLVLGALRSQTTQEWQNLKHLLEG